MRCFRALALCSLHFHCSLKILLFNGFVYLLKFRYHPMIPCNIPIHKLDFEELWYHIPPQILPKDWSCRWSEYYNYNGFMSDPRYMNYNLDHLKFYLFILYGVISHVKGVMYCPREQKESLIYSCHPQFIVMQNVHGDYYYYGPEL